MTRSSYSTHQRLIQAALQLFAAQGITDTTTRQIAELAGVNEVTLFRHFGSKNGLLLAVIEDAGIFTWLGETLGQQASQSSTVPEALRTYANQSLWALERIPELVRSLIGEAGQYPPENRQALGRGLNQANRYTTQFLTTVLHHQHLQTHLPIEKLASLLNSLLLGYLVLKLTSEGDEPWKSQEEFLTDLIELFLHGALTPPILGTVETPTRITPVLRSTLMPADSTDLPASLVHSILKQAKKMSLQDYALAYVLFAGGLSAEELSLLERSHSIIDYQHHLLQIPQGRVRQVPLNQWILGRRYGSHPHNPLTRWLKSRKDSQPALFLNAVGNPITEVEIRLRWQLWVDDLLTPQGYLPAIAQTQHTWCIEMLMRGVSLETLSLLTGKSTAELQPYANRAHEKEALEQAIRFDQKPSNSTP
ncbi:TetR family transcriptional regulator [Oscillatoria sp. FACHB-1407]|uniref:TetR family transcriptional regulator n=1 Tax=Oscillatoria sp. FACHB-1407 TaxID=2692847 RepID=UPI001681E45A|nr:TetR family transcriptional regulator [Oscillatoria sp. FACHB-1407]MBD2463960.1 TetR family transcriptional regulator [Oscillatoria sp. FACHB-1407]